MSNFSASYADQAIRLAQAGDVRGAFRALEAGIAARSATSAATLAAWRMSGDLIRRDLVESRELYGKAAEWGLPEVEDIYIALLANGAGGSGRAWSKALERLTARSTLDDRHQIALIQAMGLSFDGEPSLAAHAVTLRSDPVIERYPGFLSAAECSFLIERAAPMLQPAVVFHPQTGQQLRDPVRTAQSAAFPFALESPAIHAINRRIAKATGTAYEQGEPLQVLCYDPGDEYKLHSDALPKVAHSNQRTETFLVALNIGYHGGETAFPHLGIEWRGALGEALHFRNLEKDGSPSQAMFHAGRPVERGRKFLLSKWLREKPLDLSGPPDRLF